MQSTLLAKWWSHSLLFVFLCLIYASSSLLIFPILTNSLVMVQCAEQIQEQQLHLHQQEQSDQMNLPSLGDDEEEEDMSLLELSSNPNNLPPSSNGLFQNASSSSSTSAGARTLRTPDCLNCASLNKEVAVHLKVEAIKKQILSKLQLKERPKITSSIPRELVMEALRKAHLDVDKLSHRRRVNSINKQHSSPSSSTSSSSSSSSPSSSSSSSSHSYSTASDGIPILDQTQSDAANDDFLEEDYEDQNQYQDFTSMHTPNEDYYGKTKEIITFSEPGDTVNGHTLIEFLPHQDKVYNLEVTKASLWVQLRLNGPLSRKTRHALRDHTLTLYVFRVHNKTEGGKHLDLEMLTSKKIQNFRPGWKHIDFRVPVQKWFSGATTMRDKLTLLVDCSGCDSLVDILLFNSNNKETNSNSNSNQNSNNSSVKSTKTGVGSNSNSNNNQDSPSIRHNPAKHNQKTGYRPFLVIGTRPISHRRTKRNAITCDSKVKQCCKRQLYVSFKELGWDDWIIAPKGYNANYCMGECSKGRNTPDTLLNFHSHVMDEYRNKNPFASISPCCAPSRLSSMSLIYFDPDLNIIKADLPNMVVEECGCT